MEADDRVMTTRDKWGASLWETWCKRYLLDMPHPELVSSLSANRAHLMCVFQAMERDAPPIHVTERAYFDPALAAVWFAGRIVYKHVTSTRDPLTVDGEVSLLSEVIMGDDDESWEELATHKDALLRLTQDLLPDGVPDVSPGDWEALWTHIERYETA